MGAPYPMARIRLKTGRACEMLGDRDSARTETEIARDGFRALGAEPDRKAAETALRRLDPREGALLTPRQSEVLRLVARGLTNREIAARLGISERTVDRHVGDILTRVDAPTRAAAAAFAVASGLIDAGGPG
ncbi:MAG TPA: LuxR C-terminal-related transcriptional regulator [Afifellaceae bacterium]|nr:LuxR C-terminal-related transcriptional regulator [Afifellaceae bacterium]